MASLVSRSSGNWIFTLKALLLFTAVLSTAVILKLSIPLVLHFVVSELPGLWTNLSLWLTPPYLYVIINGIIITIAASSRFQHKIDGHHEPVLAPAKVLADVRPEYVLSEEYDSMVMRSPVLGFADVKNQVMMKDLGEKERGFGEVSQMEVYGKGGNAVLNPNVGSDGGVVDDDFVISRSNWTPTRSDQVEVSDDCSFSTEKPLVSSRFGHRKTVKTSPEGGKALGVAKPKRYDTLESTWKTITDGRAMPLTRHLKKSETWETHGRHRAQDQSSPPHHHQSNNNNNKVKKSETFKERSTAPSLSPSPGSGKLKKEPSLSQDELNRRVEAFIKKFNEEMRLQRQESLNQYREMMNRGALQ